MPLALPYPGMRFRGSKNVPFPGHARSSHHEHSNDRALIPRPQQAYPPPQSVDGRGRSARLTGGTLEMPTYSRTGLQPQSARRRGRASRPNGGTLETTYSRTGLQEQSAGGRGRSSRLNNTPELPTYSSTGYQDGYGHGNARLPERSNPLYGIFTHYGIDPAQQIGPFQDPAFRDRYNQFGDMYQNQGMNTSEDARAFVRYFLQVAEDMNRLLERERIPRDAMSQNVAAMFRQVSRMLEEQNDSYEDPRAMMSQIPGWGFQADEDDGSDTESMQSDMSMGMGLGMGMGPGMGMAMGMGPAMGPAMGMRQGMGGSGMSPGMGMGMGPRSGRRQNMRSPW